MNKKYLFFLKKFIPKRIKEFLYKKYFRRSTKKYKKCYEGYCIAIQKTIKNGSEHINLAPLFKDFKRNSINYNYFDEEWWYHFIFAANTSEGQSIESRKFLINVTKEIAEEDIDIRDFVHIYNISLNLGLLHLGYYLREKAIMSSINRLKKNKILDKNDFFYGIPALYEKNEYSYLSDIFNKNGSYRNVTYSTLFDVLKNKKIKRKSVNNFSESFQSYINGKTIAIVGPAKSHHNDAKEIDSYDLVVRCNYKEEGIGTDESTKGVRCDISYFNGKQTRFLQDSNLLNFPEKIDWIVTKNNKNQNILKHSFKNQGLINFYRFRNLHRADKYLFNGRSNAIPNIVYDLLLYNPAKIKIFHADFMLTVDRNKGYSLDQSSDEFNRKQNFLKSISRSHDPISQFLFIKNLYNNNLIAGDSKFEYVINLSVEQFMVKLQEIYGEAGYLKNNGSNEV